jgi:tetraacyldisaccharide 4'-kinase
MVAIDWLFLQPKLEKIVTIARVLLLPFAWTYGLITAVRNYFYDSGIFKSYSFGPAVICVGNLNVGGSGKSPMIEYLAKLLSENWEVSILSRGYKRKTSGFRLANESDDALTLGDEPFQFYKKFGKKILVAVCSDRVEGIQTILNVKPSVKVILLDDAYQHRRVKPLFTILLTELSNPFYKDFILPAGRLRENRNGAKRSDVMVVTKCDSFSENISQEVTKQLSVFKKPVFFSRIDYKNPVSFSGSCHMGNEILLVTGIANPRPLVEFLNSRFKVTKHFSFADHHPFTEQDIQSIQKEATPSILTTEKDFVRLGSNLSIDKNRWFYLPIETEFIHRGSEFDEMLIESIQAHLKKSD